MQKNIDMLPLSTIVKISPVSYASINIEHDNINSLKNYIPSASTLDIVERFSAGLDGSTKGRMLSITGPYGSGKSTMGVFLSSLFSSSNDIKWKTSFNILKNEWPDTAKELVNVREKLDVQKNGLIGCLVTARREPISVTILRALENGLDAYVKKMKTSSLKKKIDKLQNNKIPSTAEIIEIIEDVCKIAPVVIMIDEFGKNIEYFTIDETQQSDLFVLQEIAEMSGKGRKIPLSIITLQHMAFEEYAAGASTIQKQEWAKIQGRFEDIPFSNSLDQTRLLVSNTIKINKSQVSRRAVKNWAKNEIKNMQKCGIDNKFDSDLISSCYPLSPLVLEILPELCSRYGQHERTLLSFLSDPGKYTVATFIENHSLQKGSLPVISIDMLYDYFISGTNMMHSSSANITRLMEIETIIRDSHGLSDLEKRALKTIGILNLIGRTGYLRASQRIIDYAVSNNSKQLLEKLKDRSIIIFREYADEYRIWHGTDIDIATKLDIYRKRYQKAELAELLDKVMNLEPVVAAKHSIKTGNMRLFKRSFTTKSDLNLDEQYDGVIVYTTDSSFIINCSKPVITVIAKNTYDLQRTAVEVMAIRDILENDEDVTSEWVARGELEERLANAEIILDREFGNTYGSKAVWSYLKDGKKSIQKGTPSTIASLVCDHAYFKTPKIYNEMINRNVLSAQGASARKKLIEKMIMNSHKCTFGIDGYGADKAVYDAVFLKNKIHVIDSKLQWKLNNPTSEAIAPVWNEMISTIKQTKKRLLLSQIYETCKMPPFGMKDGIAPILMVAIILIHKNNMALYEHGTYTPAITPEISERMIKNPGYYEIKYFKSTPTKKIFLRKIIADLKINSEGSVLDVVGHLVRIVSTLPPYIKNTKKLDKHTLALRNEVLTAVEPDTLLFESLPKAWGLPSFNSKVSEVDMTRFSKILLKSTNILQNKFTQTFEDMKQLLFQATGINDREKLSKASAVILKHVSDQKMKVFLTAVSADTLEREEDWLNYIALSITDVPPTDWKDEQHQMFENNLIDISKKFNRLVSIQFANISDNFVKPSYQVTITHADGKEYHHVISLKPNQKKIMNDIVKKTMADMKKKGFTDKDIGSLIAMLSSKSQ